MRTLYTSASIVRADGIEHGSVLVDGGTVVEVGVIDPPAGVEIIDLGGAWLGPGLVDIHVHFRDPGQTSKEDMATGAAAAAAGGFTAVVMMPNTEPPIDTGTRAAEVLRQASMLTGVAVSSAGALTGNRSGEGMADFEGMYRAGIRLFSDDGDSVADAGLLRRIMAYLTDFPGAVIAEHAEEPALSRGGHLNQGAVSSVHGLGGLPGAAEDLIVARDLLLAEDAGARIHIQHVSTARSIDLIRRARQRGVDVSAEVTPHHLALDEDDVMDLDANKKMYPPLRGKADRVAVAEALIDGTIDVVATDHAPHRPEEKDLPFEEAPRGVIGLETAAAVVNEVLEGDQAAFFDRMSIRPAAIAGLTDHGQPIEPGAPANLVIFDPSREWVPARFHSKSSNSPFLSREMRGMVLTTIRGGEITYQGASR